MKLKTKEQLTEEVFIHISTNVVNDLEVWARFTGYEDCIQYINYKDGIRIGEIQTTSFGRLILFEQMYHKMMQYPKVNQNGYIEKVSEKWLSDLIGKYSLI